MDYWTAGTPFHVDAPGVTIGALGYFDPMSYWGFSQDGLSTAHNVGIYDASQNLLCSVLVPSGPGVTLRHDTRWVDLNDPVTLPGNSDYILAFTITGFANDFLIGRPDEVVIGSGFSLAGSGWTGTMIPGLALQYPGIPSTADFYIFGGNMETVPEPSQWAMMLTAGAIFVARISARRRCLKGHGTVESENTQRRVSVEDFNEAPAQSAG